MTEFIKDYVAFVNSVTSEESRLKFPFRASLDRMEDQFGTPPQRLITAALGLSAEAGEFGDLVKKCLFQGKELNKENRELMIKELGDVMWYLSQGCMALGVTIDEVLWANIDKLEKRYPNGFEVSRSENRSKVDV
ncbi:MAG: nucleoside triphosphate pyrophosphohydrolase family protein [Methylophilaceae bacterium]